MFSKRSRKSSPPAWKRLFSYSVPVRLGKYEVLNHNHQAPEKKKTKYITQKHN